MRQYRSMENLTAAVLIIGNEILSGRTRDINLNMIAEKLLSVGIPVMEARIVRDDEKAIIEAVNSLRSRYTYLFTTGGIGPTHDDITSAAIAKAFNLPLEMNNEAEKILRNYYPKEALNQERLKMARMPKGAEIIENPVTVIPGFSLENVFVLAGVPEVAKAMMDAIMHKLKRGSKIVSVTVRTELTEGTIAGELTKIANSFPEVEIGSYPSLRQGRPCVAIVVRGANMGNISRAVEEIKAMIKGQGGEPKTEFSDHD